MTPFVFIHGGACTGVICSGLTPIPPTGALAVSLPGRTNESVQANGNICEWVTAAVPAMDAEGVGRAIVVAHSMGGGARAAMARLFASRMTVRFSDRRTYRQTVRHLSEG